MMNRRSARPRLYSSLTAPILLGLGVVGACVRAPVPLPPVETTEVSTASPGLASSEQVVRVGFLNTRMLPFSSAGSRADVIAARIIGGGFAIVALSEVFSETGRERLVELLEAEYPYRVEFLGSRKLHRLDSGLMLLSRLPLSAIADSIPFRTIRVRASTDAGSEPEQAAAFVRFVEFDDCASKDCWAAKGVGYVRVALSGRPLHLFFTHMQASYGSDDEEGRRATFAARASQRVQMGSFIQAVAGDDLRQGENALVIGDLNVDGSTGASGETLQEEASGSERSEMMSQLSVPFPFGLTDAWTDHGPPEDPGLTFPVRNLSVRFDYVLASLPDTMTPLCVKSIATAFGLDTQRTPESIDITVERQVTDHVGLVVELVPAPNGCALVTSADRNTPATGR
jgi:hypothetical protein